MSDGGAVTLERLHAHHPLGQGVGAAGRLDPAAIERTLDVLAEYREVMDRFGVTRTRMAATSAARDATNRDDFFVPAAELVGAAPELLSGERGGRLSFLGATADLDRADGPFLVFDIGGGSTEFVYGTDAAEAAVSTDMGCVRMTEAWLHHDPPTAEELSQCLSIVELHLDDVQREIPDAVEARTFVGLAGTVSAAAAVEIGLAAYDRDRIHHFRLTRDAAEDVFRTLATEALADRVHNPGLERERADVIVGGMCVLVAIDAPLRHRRAAWCRSPTSSTVWPCRSRHERCRDGAESAHESPVGRHPSWVGSPVVTTLFGRRVLLRPWWCRTSRPGVRFVAATTSGSRDGNPPGCPDSPT